VGDGNFLISSLIHNNSQFKNKLPVTIDFKKISNQNIENLLNEKNQDLGENLLVRANQNTLILLNIDLLPINYQKKLLFFLENSNFFENSKISLKQKIISISEKNIPSEIESGNFIKRLYERISIDKIYCPSLSERREDIVPLLEYYISNFNNINNAKISFSQSAIAKLQLYDWPGNVLQIKNYVEKTIILNQGIERTKKLEVDDLALEMGDYVKDSSNNSNLDLSLKDARSKFEKDYLLSQIKRFNGNMSKVSEYTGMERTALYKKN
jgi:Response regulator containing CheY-like receiver, AAA-type ATPase, and DNA-binding domains